MHGKNLDNVTMTRLEDILVKDLAAKLRPKAARIWVSKKPSASTKFKNRIQSKLGYIPILQPEIDLCLLSNEGDLVAVEAKLFKGSELTYLTPFYEGIGQALALHRYGFDAVALWFLFLEGTTAKGMNRYGAEAWAFVRNDLNLPLDFSYISVEKAGAGHSFSVMQYSGRQVGFTIRSIDDPLFLLKWKHPNPIKCLPVQRALRDALEWWLGIQSERQNSVDQKPV